MRKEKTEPKADRVVLKLSNKNPLTPLGHPPTDNEDVDHNVLKKVMKVVTRASAHQTPAKDRAPDAATVTAQNPVNAQANVRVTHVNVRQVHVNGQGAEVRLPTNHLAQINPVNRGKVTRINTENILKIRIDLFPVLYRDQRLLQNQ